MEVDSATGKAFSLFNACLPENEDIEKQLLLQEILSMGEYNALKYNNNAKHLMESTYSFSTLSTKNAEELKAIKEAIPIAAKTLEKIRLYKKYGDLSKLTLKIKPNFTSKKSLETFIGFAENLSEYENYTNIPDNDYSAIFDVNTITSLEEMPLPVDTKDLSNIKANLISSAGSKKYCISSKIFADIEMERNKQIARINEVKLELKKSNKRRILIKLIVSISYLTVTLSVIGNLNHPEACLIYFVISAIAWVLYLIKG